MWRVLSVQATGISILQVTDEEGDAVQVAEVNDSL